MRIFFKSGLELYQRQDHEKKPILFTDICLRAIKKYLKTASHIIVYENILKHISFFNINYKNIVSFSRLFILRVLYCVIFIKN